MFGYQDNSGLYITSGNFNGALKKRYILLNIERTKLIAKGDRYRHKKMPEHYHIYAEDSLRMVVKVPFGILGSSFSDRFMDRRTILPDVIGHAPFRGTLRDDQKNALSKLLEKRVGIMKAGTGTGKSYMILSLIPQLKRNSLILVNATTTLSEMVQKCQDLLGEIPIVIGGTKKYKNTTNAITVCMMQSMTKLDLKKYGLIIVDECDVSISTTKRQAHWFNCSPDYLYGFSATTEINNQEDHLINIFFGLTEESLMANNFKPIVKEVHTNYMYSGSLDSDAEFSKMMTEISEDTARNKLIIQTVYDTLLKTETKKGLLLVKRTEQAKVFQEALTAKGIESHIIIGETKEEERKEIRDRVASTQNPVIIIGSAQILGRGFDLPALQTVYIQYPNKFEAALVQVVGRVLRKSEGKTYAQVYDFVDSAEEALRNQSFSRRRSYRKTYG